MFNKYLSRQTFTKAEVSAVFGRDGWRQWGWLQLRPVEAEAEAEAKEEK